MESKMSPDKSEPRVYKADWLNLDGINYYLKKEVVLKSDHDKAIQLKDARIAELEAEVKQEYIDNASREKEIVAHNAELQQKLTEAEKIIDIIVNNKSVMDLIDAIPLAKEYRANLKTTEG